MCVLGGVWLGSVLFMCRENVKASVSGSFVWVMGRACQAKSHEYKRKEEKRKET